MIHNIKRTDVQKMNDREGIVLQGCGGNPQDWVDGINDVLTKSGILLDNTQFTDVYVFKHKRLTNILFIFDDSVHINIGKLAIWRLATHNNFGGTWLSDYVNNKLPIETKLS